MITEVGTERREWCVVENGGQRIFGVVHRPQGIDRAPCVVIMHGFASSKHGTNRSHVTLSERLVAEGIASLRFDFRGAGDSEGSLSEISLEDLISDALVILHHTAQLDGIDPERIGIFGASLGGSIAVISAARSPHVRALALWAPVASGELWYRDFIAQNPDKLTEDPKTVLSHYRGIKISPLFQEQFGRMRAAQLLEEVDLPLLHMQGEQDQTVSLLHQKVYKMHNENNMSPARFISYPQVDHQLGVERCAPEVMRETVRFFHEHLSPVSSCPCC